MLEHDETLWRHKRINAGQCLVSRMVVRRVEQNDVEWHERRALPEPLHGPAGSCADNSIAARYAAPRQVLLDQPLCPAIAVDKGDVSGPATQCLDSHSAGSRI